MRTVLVSEIVSFLKSREINFYFHGSTSDCVRGFSSLTNYKDGSLTWVKEPTLFNRQKENPILHLVITEPNSGITAQNIIEANNSKEVFFSVLQHFWETEKKVEIANDSVVLTSDIGKNVAIGHHCSVGMDVSIGDNVRIGNNVQIECPCHIGNNSIIGSGVVIGTDGFGYYRDAQGFYRKVPHL